MLSITIDWLAGTFKEYTREAEKFIADYASATPTQDITPRNGYERACVDGNGVQLLWNSDRAGMGYHVIFAGSALRNILERDCVQVRTLLHAFVNSGGRISRLDLAKDRTGEAVDMQTIYQSLERGDYEGTARKFAKIESNDGGFTIYVGSRQSERFLRLYNKAAESKLQGELWFRMELETKGMVARSVASLLLDTEQWGRVFDGCINAMVDLHAGPDWTGFLNVDNVPIALPKIEKHGDRERWIDAQVISAVAKHFIDNPQSEAVKRLRETLDFIDRQRKL